MRDVAVSEILQDLTELGIKILCFFADTWTRTTRFGVLGLAEEIFSECSGNLISPALTLSGDRSFWEREWDISLDSPPLLPLSRAIGML